jgi:hypothetical protein
MAQTPADSTLIVSEGTVNIADSSMIINDTSVIMNRDMEVMNEDGKSTLFAGGDNNRVGVGTNHPTDNLSVYSDKSASFSLFKYPDTKLKNLDAVGMRIEVKGLTETLAEGKPGPDIKTNNGVFISGIYMNTLSGTEVANAPCKLGGVPITYQFAAYHFNIKNGYMCEPYEALTIGENGMIGVNNLNPLAPIDIKVASSTANALVVRTTSKINFEVKNNGEVFARKVTVTLNDFPDYVFANDYKLMPLKVLEAYLSSNKHLPNMPTAAEVQANGADLGEINKALVEKVEELTLYIIEMNKRMEAIEVDIKKINK